MSKQISCDICKNKSESAGYSDCWHCLKTGLFSSYCQPTEECFELKEEKKVEVFDYLKECKRTEPDDNEYQKILDNLTIKDLRLIHSALGMITEVGEAVDIIKKFIFYGKPLDIKHLQEELVDCHWYQAIPANIFNFTFEEIQKQNIEKLRKRYPEKFDKERALNRDEDDFVVAPYSSNVASMEYMREDLTLIIKMKDGDSYKYFDIPVDIWDGLRQAKSVGSYIHRNMRGHYRYHRITD